MRNKKDHHQLKNKKILIYFHARFRYQLLLGNKRFNLLGQRFQAEGFLDETTATVDSGHQILEHCIKIYYYLKFL